MSKAVDITNTTELVITNLGSEDLYVGLDKSSAQTIELGASWLSVPITPEHVFYESVRVHDQHYYDLMAKTSSKTLAQIDREFLRNMLRQAWALPELWQRVKWTRRAWLYYRAARAWAKLVRANLDDYLTLEKNK